MIEVHCCCYCICLRKIITRASSMNFTCWSERSVDYGAYRKRLRDNKVKFKKQSVSQPEIQKCNAENQTNQRSLLVVKKNFQAILVGFWSTSELILLHVPDILLNPIRTNMQEFLGVTGEGWSTSGKDTIAFVVEVVSRGIIL